MKIVIAGGHGKVARALSRVLSGQGHEVVGVVRKPEQSADLEADGAQPLVLDLETASVEELGGHLRGADAAVFAAGAGPGSGPGRKRTVDLGAAVLLADAAEVARVPRLVQVSSAGVESVRGAGSGGVEGVMVDYLRAKLAAEEDLRRRELGWTIVRPGSLTDDEGTGRVRLAEDAERGSVPRQDVAAVLAELVVSGVGERRTLELVSGDRPVREAVAAFRA